jgi:tetratricopeptide (TPR) repeat protein
MVALTLTMLAAACASRTPPPTPTALKYPDFLFPVVPSQLATSAGAQRFESGWRFLQNDDLRQAEQEFTATLKQTPGFYPAQAGLGYVALARRDYARAVTSFAAALRPAPQYVPALVGQGQAELARGREAEALAAFETALAADASLADLRQRVEVLRFRNLQTVIENARGAAAAGRLDEARLAFTRALEASPDSAFLHRELGSVERRRGAGADALVHFRRAAELDAADAASLVQIGELLEEQQDLTGAEAAYRRAIAIEPNPDISRRITTIVERARDARLPQEFRAIADARQITRADLAALLGIRLETVIRNARPREVVITDTRGHWAEPWITQVAQAGVVAAFDNHTFQPGSQVRRADLATAVSEVVRLLAAGNASLRPYLTERPRIADVPPGHLNYPAVAVAVTSGVMPLADGGRFQIGLAVTGAEAVETITRLRTLAGLR